MPRYAALRTFSDVELAWLAGLLEGEGYFGIITSHVAGKKYRYARVGVTMTDRDVIERVAAFWSSKVSVVVPNGKGSSKKTYYRAHLFGKRAVQMMRSLHPLLGTRRQAQIDRVFKLESERTDPNEARRMWSINRALTRPRKRGRFMLEAKVIP